MADLQANLAEVESRLLEARRRLVELEASTFPRRDLVAASRTPTTALVVWRPSGGTPGR